MNEALVLNFGGEHVACVDVVYKSPGKWKTRISAAQRELDLDYSNAAIWDSLTVDRVVLAAFITAHNSYGGSLDLDLSQEASAESALDHLITYFRFRLFEAGRLHAAQSLLPEYESLFSDIPSAEERAALLAELLAKTKSSLQEADWTYVFEQLDRGWDVWECWMNDLYSQADYHNIWVEPGRF